MTATKIGSLFSGTGALDLAAEEVFGAVPAWFCEYDKAPSAILAHHWPEVHNYGDVTTMDWATVPAIDILTAGYPCQPFSLAGVRKGQDDARHLWPYVAAAIRHLRPRYVLLENVRGHLSLGFGTVLGDLAALGYDAQWSIVRASAAGAPHRRERIFILAQDADRKPGDERRVTAPGQAESGRPRADAGRRDRTPAAHADSTGLERQHGTPGTAPAKRHGHAGAGTDWGKYAGAVHRWERVTGHPAPWPTVPTGRAGRERMSAELPEWMMGLPPGHITAVPGLSWKDQVKAAGNGVCPQQAALAFRHLLKVSTL